MNFDAEKILNMDYRALRRYMEEAVIMTPSLSKKMHAVDINEGLREDSTPSKMAMLRCVSAYMGVSDPLRNIS